MTASEWQAKGLCMKFTASFLHLLHYLQLTISSVDAVNGADCLHFPLWEGISGEQTFI